MIFNDFIKSIKKKNEFSLNANKINLITVEDGVIEYCTFGKGEPIILIIGYASTLSAWDIRFLYKLSQAYKVIVFNNRNTGGKFFENTENYFMTDLAHDIEKLRIGLSLNKVYICGISMGGMIAQLYASLYPNNLKKLILINTVPPGNLAISPNEKVIKILKTLNKSNIINYFKMLNLLFPNLWKIIFVPIYHFKPKNSTIIAPSSTIEQQQLAIEQWIIEPQAECILKNIISPTLILCAEKDKLIPPENSKIINKYLKNSQLITYANGGHIMIYQYPLKLASTIINFLLTA